MATMQITVWEGAAETALGDIIQEEVVTIAAAAANSNPVAGADRRARKVRIYCDADAYVHWGAPGVTATVDGDAGRMIGADNPEYFTLEAGQEVSVIARA